MTDCPCAGELRRLRRQVLLLQAEACTERAGRLRAEALADGAADLAEDAHAALALLSARTKAGLS